jgi:hypothetical protein
MTETLMPLRWSDLDTSGGMTRGGGRLFAKRNRIEPSTASTLKDDSPRGLVLNKESMTVKFNKHVIIGNKTKHGKEMFANMGNMKNIF